jgi:hypothetical protein
VDTPWSKNLKARRRIVSMPQHMHNPNNAMSGYMLETSCYTLDPRRGPAFPSDRPGSCM